MFIPKRLAVNLAPLATDELLALCYLRARPHQGQVLREVVRDYIKRYGRWRKPPSDAHRFAYGRARKLNIALADDRLAIDVANLCDRWDCKVMTLVAWALADAIDRNRQAIDALAHIRATQTKGGQR